MVKVAEKEKLIRDNRAVMHAVHPNQSSFWSFFLQEKGSGFQ
jgi:hypothetical protein